MTAVPRVMLSSTSIDLPHYREAARDACLAADALPLMMEHLPASDADALRVSMEMVDRCDIYVGILAHRYGYVPAGSEKSITQQEYERAGERGIPRLMFLIHRDASVRIDDVETGTGAERLAAFKEQVAADRVVHFFRSEDDLRAATLQALTTLLPATSTPASHQEGADLVISSLDSARRVSPLAGHPVLTRSADARPVYCGGAQLSFTLAHNAAGRQSVNVQAMVLEVLDFTPGRIAELDYRIAGDEVIGAGVARPHVFQVTVAASRVEPARWVLDATRGKVARANSDNFFDLDEPRILTFPADGADIEEIRGTVLAIEPGLYEVRFVFHYSVGGSDRSQQSASLLLYSDE